MARDLERTAHPCSMAVMSAGARPRLLDEVRARLRLKHYSLRTERACIGWMRRFILANGRRHPRELGGAEVEAFLSDLAVRGEVAPGTQNQALSALIIYIVWCSGSTFLGWRASFGRSGHDVCRRYCRAKK